MVYMSVIDPQEMKEVNIIKELEEVYIDLMDPEKKTFVGSKLPIKQKELIGFVTKHKSVFAWSHSYMTGIDPNITTHKLRVDPGEKLVKQKKQRFAPDKNDAINKEVQKLLKARSITEVSYPNWFSNEVFVKKTNGKNRICVDYSDLKKACPKDLFLPHIDLLVDATGGHEMMSLMDALSETNH